MKQLIIGLLFWLGGLCIGVCIGLGTIYTIKPKIDLPEEYKNINPSTPILGYFDQDSILHIEFDNNIKFEWEGLERDIPKDGIRTLQLTTEENIIYLNPIDE